MNKSKYLFKNLILSRHEKANVILVSAFVLLLPFVLLYWLVPGFSGLTIGNDYIHYPIEAQMEVAYSLESGVFPLYAPGFAGGQSAAALTLGQLYHPIVHFARNIPGYWGGDALSINTVLRLFSLGMVQLLLVYVLRQFKLSWLSSIVLSMVAVYNLRMLDHFRYGASLENHTAFISLCCFVLLCFQKGRSWPVALGLVASTYLLVVGGHPQVTYFGLLGGGILALFTPYFMNVLAMTNAKLDFRSNIKNWLWLLALVLVGVGLAAPYIASFYFEFLQSNSLRTDNPYIWSLAYQDSVGGALRNLYAPLGADVSGAFGGSALLMILLSFPVLLLWYRRVPLPIWSLYIFSVMVFVLCLGNATPLHQWVWEYFPLANKFRVPGRFSLLLIFPVLLLFVWIIKSSSLEKLSLFGRFPVSLLSVLSLLAWVLLVLMHLVVDPLLPASGPWTPQAINSFPDRFFDYWFYLGNLVLGGLFIYSILNEDTGTFKKWAILLGLVIAIFAQVLMVQRYGTWVTSSKKQQTFTQMETEKNQDFRLYATPGFGLSSSKVDEQLSKNILNPRPARLYRDIKMFKSIDEVWTFLATKRNGRQAAVLSASDVSMVDALSAIPDEINLESATFNRFVYNVNAQQSSLFATNIPFDRQWEVIIDDTKAETYQANGHELAVLMPAGKHRVTLTYLSPATRYGMIVSCLCLAGFLLYFSLLVSSRYRVMTLILALALPGLGFYLWSSSLYSGEGSDNKYVWSSQDLPAADNLAFGKVTGASSVDNVQMPYLFSPSRAVDGKRGGEPFASLPSKNPSWKLDLGGHYYLNSIQLYGVEKRSFPILVWVSDSEQGGFTNVGQFKRFQKSLVVDLDDLEARYVVVSSAKSAALIMREVEVYGSPRKD